MKKVTRFMTLDGKTHRTTKDAADHLADLFGSILEGHARKLAQLDKYTLTTEYLHNQDNLKDFAYALEILKDIDLLETED